MSIMERELFKITPTIHLFTQKLDIIVLYSNFASQKEDFMNKKPEEEKKLWLDDLPVSSQTLTLGNHFMISDTFDSGSSDKGKREFLLSDRFLNMPFRIRFTIILLCTEGAIRLRTHMKEYLLTRGDMLLIMEGSIGECLEITGDIKIIMMAFSSRFKVMETGFKPSMEILSEVGKHPCLRMTEREIEDITSIYNIMRHRMEDTDFIGMEELATSCLTTFFYYISNHIFANITNPIETMGRAQKIHENFLELVETHSLRHREVSFYADKLCITPKYLSKMVLQASGKSAKDWIFTRIMLEAKVLLLDRSRSIQEISEILGFPNQSSFGTFFRKMKGMSPSAYRLLLK